jgi:hypothetical protein
VCRDQRLLARPPVAAAIAGARRGRENAESGPILGLPAALMSHIADAALGVAE